MGLAILCEVVDATDNSGDRCRVERDDDGAFLVIRNHQGVDLAVLGLTPETALSLAIGLIEYAKAGA